MLFLLSIFRVCDLYRSYRKRHKVAWKSRVKFCGILGLDFLYTQRATHSSQHGGSELWDPKPTASKSVLNKSPSKSDFFEKTRRGSGLPRLKHRCITTSSCSVWTDIKPNIIFGWYIKCGAKTVVKNLSIIIVAISCAADACLIYYSLQIKHMLVVTKPVTIKLKKKLILRSLGAIYFADETNSL